MTLGTLLVLPVPGLVVLLVKGNLQLVRVEGLRVGESVPALRLQGKVEAGYRQVLLQLQEIVFRRLYRFPEKVLIELERFILQPRVPSAVY